MHSLSCHSDSVVSSALFFIWIGAVRLSVESCNSPETDECEKSRLMLASFSISWLFSLGSALLDQVVGPRGWLRFTMVCMAPCGARKSHTPLFSRWPERLIDLHCVIFANMHTLADSFSKPRLFSHPFKDCSGCFSLGIDSEVMYGKSYLNICIRLENTLVLEHYTRRLLEKRVSCRPGSCDYYSKLQKVGKSGLWGRQVMTLQSCWRF